MTETSTASLPRKRLIICCDGTWKDSDGDVQVPSNVTRISRAIDSMGFDHSVDPPVPMAQIVFYQNGVGTGSKSLYTKIVGGATGGGMSVNVREAYSFICLNYRDGDEIVLIGFSRGAFTARSVSSLIRSVGLLTAAGLEFLTPIFEDWKYQEQQGWKSRFPNEPFPNRGKLDSDAYRRKLLELEYTRLQIPIKCVAVWDTVGALGIPKIFLLPQSSPTDYQLVNTCVEPNIEYAFQALALDERRRPYHPTIWEKPDSQELPRVLKQTWFPGVHSDIGGSYEDADLANITLAWMVTQLAPLLSFNFEIVSREIRKSKELHEAKNEPIRAWGLGRIHNSMSLFFRIFGTKIRTPMEYLETDYHTQKHTSRRLHNTNEFIHSSVRIRMGKHGLGYDDQGIYDSPALSGWEFTGIETHEDTPIQKGLPGQAGKMKNVIWKKEIETKNADGEIEKITLEMPEDVLEGYERRILKLWPELLKEFDAILPGDHRAHIRRSVTDPAKPDETTPLLRSPSHRESPSIPPIPGPADGKGTPKSSGRVVTF